SQNLHECCLCLTNAKNVVTLPCRHNFCRSCLISEYEGTDSYSCLQCSQIFSMKPGPSEKVMDNLKKMDLHTETTAGTTTEREDVACDVCTEGIHTAIKSCLVCLASYCETHLWLHEHLHARAAHTLVDATAQLQAMTCSTHGKVLEVYCRNEEQRICCMCMLEDHKGHDMVAAGQENLRKSKQMITEQEKQLKEFHLAENTLKDIATATEEECERLFSQLVHSIKRSGSAMKVLIRARERAELYRIKELMDQAEEEIRELKSRELSRTPNDLLQSASGNVTKMTINPQFSFGEVVKSVSALKERIEDVWQHETDRISWAVKKDKIVVPSEPKTRKDFLQYLQEQDLSDEWSTPTFNNILLSDLVPLSLDPDSAHRSLRIYDEKRVVCSTEYQPYPYHPERFDWWAQVLCREPLNRRCYWEAEWAGLHGVDIAVSYRDITRKGDGDECSFGYNKQSWSLDCAILKYTFAHDNVETEILGPVSHKIGVYLDYKAGVMCFYSVSGTLTLLHRAEMRFTQPLYAGFGLYQGSTVKICQL
ncbi:tripartite motif-containing protein 16, partial [Silurus asotus]